jgi:hypothetical protein
MADGVRRHNYDLNIHLISILGESFNGSFVPSKANPYREDITERLKSEGRRKQESDKGWKALGKYLGMMAKDRKKIK